MVRKQLYIASEQERKVRRLAARWRCTEAHVIRTALDRLADEDDSVEDRLKNAGVLVPPRLDADAPTGKALEALEREYDGWLASQPSALGLTEAVLADRR